MKPVLPQWNLDSVYPSFQAVRFREDKILLAQRIEALKSLLEPALSGVLSGDLLVTIIRALESAGDAAENLSAFCEAVYTANTKDTEALAQINEVDAIVLPLGKYTVLFRTLIARQKETVEKLFAGTPLLESYRFFLYDSLEKAKYQLSPEMEDLANDLYRSGADAWTRLHSAVSSTASALWNEQTGERKTVIALRDLAHDPDRLLRQKAYYAELVAWKEAEIPLAAALNGVKGQALTLDKRRGWKSPLHKSSVQSRISEKALDALMGALEDALPLFRSYLKTKAAALGIGQCSFYDIFAPLQTEGHQVKRWSWDESKEMILACFDSFDPDMAAFARKAFDSAWIDAQGREGKIGGAYCTDFPLSGESRILCNFEGSFDSVTTVAHELGHAWHSAVLRDLPRFQSAYPMTLAETASIFAETIVFENALHNAGEAERRVLIESSIKDSCQVIVDILSRFYFEKELFARRVESELAPDELCAMMLNAQQKTYGDGLNDKELHPYMWAVKSHYYSAGLGFYNYPYAFGQLFALALYARAQKEGRAFAGSYRALLRETGRQDAAGVARHAGFDIEQKSFWQAGISVIAARIEQFNG